MALAGPAKLLGETDSISSGSDREGGKIATGREFNRAAHLLATFMNDTIVKGDVPGIIVAFRHVLKLLITDSTFDLDCERFEKGFFISNSSFLSPRISSLFCCAVTS